MWIRFKRGRDEFGQANKEATAEIRQQTDGGLDFGL